MTHRTCLAAACTAAVGTFALTASPADAADPVQCGPDARWCTGVLTKHGRTYLDVSGFALRGSYRVCVTPPLGRERCKTFTLRPNGTGAHASSVRFTEHFPHRRSGRYRARWLYRGEQLGKVLRFTR